FGIYDTLGNVWEYTSDCWTERLDSTDCKGQAVRGGSWSSPPRYLRSANRTEDTRGNRSDFGFRLVAKVSLGELSEE
ncbi:MAG: SUMF1/EgtB/PvdO family nonheme iron enzyme, partial [Gammaproteobacteria bacterium]